MGLGVLGLVQGLVSGMFQIHSFSFQDNFGGEMILISSGPLYVCKAISNNRCCLLLRVCICL